MKSAAGLSDERADDRTQNEQLNDALLRVAAGDTAAFAEVYDKTARVLLSVISGMLRDEDAARDVLQKTYLAVWKNAYRFTPEKGKAITWMLVIARNRTLDALRARSRSAETEQVPETLVDEVSIPPERSAEAALVRETLEACLGELPARMANAIRLNIMQGWTAAEIAESLGVSRNTVKSWIRRGLVKLRVEIPYDTYDAVAI